MFEINPANNLPIKHFYVSMPFFKKVSAISAVTAIKTMAI